MMAPHALDAAFLHEPALARLMRVLNHDGEHARIVGGAVRNALLGEPISDIDIATTHVPEVVQQLVMAAGLKAVPTGLAFGTITAVSDGRAFEVTSLRRDVSTDGRRAVVAYGTDWAEDAQRRDFTLNALYLGADGRLYDPLEGYEDLKRRHVRFIGDPHARIREDYLRIWRFFRFSAAYGDGKLDPAGFAAALHEREGLRTLSAERLRAELLKLLVARHASAMVTQLSGAGFLVPLIGVPQLTAFARLCHVERELMLKPDPLCRLGVLAVRIEEDAARLQERLRLSHKEATCLRQIGQWAGRLAQEPTKLLARCMLHEVGAGYQSVLLAAWALNGAPSADAGWETLLELPQHDDVPAFPLRGEDMAELGIMPGIAMGAMLERARRYWQGADFRPDKAALMAWLRATPSDL